MSSKNMVDSRTLAELRRMDPADLTDADRDVLKRARAHRRQRHLDRMEEQEALSNFFGMREAGQGPWSGARR